MNEEIRYKLLKLLSENPEMSQRDLAQELGISLGKVNYCIQAMKSKGLVKAQNFKSSPLNKRYLYLLTPRGIEEKAKVTVKFLRRKLREFDLLQEEIQRLSKEVDLTSKDKG